MGKKKVVFGTIVALMCLMIASVGYALDSYEEDFEDALGEEWSTYESDATYGRNERSTYSQNSGSYSWRMDVTSNNHYNLNELILSVSVSGATYLNLEFWTREYNDEEHSMPSAFAGHHNSDGIAVSTDGTNWKRLWQYPSSVSSWTGYGPLDITGQISVNGDVYVKFQQYNNCTIPQDGILWDDVSLTSDGLIIRKNLVANPSLSIPDEWQYQEIYGKDFWLIVRYQPYDWQGAGIEQEPFLIDSCWQVNFPEEGSALRDELLLETNPIVLWEREYQATESEFDNFLYDFGERYLGSYIGGHEWTWMCDPTEKWEYLTDRYGVPMPTTRAEAQELLFRPWKDDVIEPYPTRKLYMSVATFQQHIEGASDLEWIATETGTHGVFCDPMHFIFSRGASRQYQKPWLSYLACFTSGVTDFKYPHPRCRDHRGPRYIGRANSFMGPYCGPSISQGRRLLYLSYMGGASSVIHESDGSRIFLANYDYKTELDILVSNLKDKKWYISPIGDYWKELYDKIDTQHDRGIPYTPFGLLFDQNHGYLHPTYHGTTYDRCLGASTLPFTDADYMGRAIIDTLYPWEHYNRYGDGNEKKTLIPNPLTGDIFDAITTTSSLSTLTNYPVIVISGNVDINAEFAQKLVDYVDGGGTLYINTSQQISNFSEAFLGVELTEDEYEGSSFKDLVTGEVVSEEGTFSFKRIVPTTAETRVIEPVSEYPLVTINTYGQGHVILTTPNYLYVEGSENEMLKLFSHLIEETAKEVLPFSIEGEVEYLVNKTENSFIVTLLNNKVTKLPLEEETTDPADTEDVFITFKPDYGISMAENEWLTDEVVEKTGSTFTVIVPPEEVRIVEFK